MRRLQVQVLIVSSFVFYSFNNPYLVFLLTLSVLINGYVSFKISSSIGKGYYLALLAVVFNIVVLVFFKYNKLLFLSLSNESSFFEMVVLLPLPIGISFYTFQGISLVIDTYLDKSAQKKPAYVGNNLKSHMQNTANYIAFFPQLVAGPILKPAFFISQVKSKSIRSIHWVGAFKHIVLGYFLKLVIANNLTLLTESLASPAVAYYSSIKVFYLTVAYTVQVFADFAGYSFIAIGVGKLFGYRLLNNFNYPFISESFNEFWRRWHVTLYSWFNEYIFNPLVLNNRRSGIKGICLILVFVFTLSGIWHGATWNYAIWGATHGLLLVLEFLISHFGLNKKINQVRLVNITFVFTLICFVNLIFKFDDLRVVYITIKAFLLNWSLPLDGYDRGIYILILLFPVFLYHYFACFSFRRKKVLCQSNFILFGLMIFLIIFNSGSSQAFIYFQF